MAGYVPILFSGQALNIGSLSDVEATSLGVNVRRLRTLCFVSASVTTAAAIMLSGPIGFVGLICPHICRRIVGADHRKLRWRLLCAGVRFSCSPIPSSVPPAVSFMENCPLAW